jgi:trigger factor
MGVTVKNIEKNVVQLEFDIDAAKFEEGMQKAYIKNKHKFFVPGFRKGKAPRHIVQNYYGEGVLYEDALEAIFPELYEDAVKEHGLQPVDSPEVTEIKQIGTKTNLVFTARVTVRPEVELGQYKGIEIEKKEVNITDEDVENELRLIAERNARIIGVEEDRGIQEGDIVVIDFEGFTDGKPIEGGKSENFELEIGKGHFIEGFEEQLTGVKAGEEKEINVKFPDDYAEKSLAGKDASFNVKVKSISIKELPVIDDEFAKDVSEFDTLEEYKNDIRSKLIRDEEMKIRNATEAAVIAKAVENAAVDIPRVMIDRQVSQYMQSYAYRLQYQGMSLEQFFKNSGIDEQAFRNGLAKEAEKEVKTGLVLEKISEAENIEVTDEQVEEEIKRMADNYKVELEKFKERISDEEREHIKHDLKIKATVDFLVNNAVQK